MHPVVVFTLCTVIGLSFLSPSASFVVHGGVHTNIHILPCDSSQRIHNLHASRDPDNIRLRPSKDDDESCRNPRLIEFQLDDSINDSEVRVLRKEREQSQKQTFASFGNDLWDIRERVLDLSNKLIDAVAAKENTTNIRNEILEMEQRDAEAVYSMELDKMSRAIDEGREEDAKKHSERAVFARGHLPQYNLEGLWVGKYGDGYQLINITYIDDLLIASKITGYKNVPVGEISFQVDLTKTQMRRTLQDALVHDLPNIILSETASHRWGTRELQRFRGIGQVADETFTQSEWMEGQLVMISDDYFSFSWMPLSHQIFFGRPSPSLALKMLKDKELHQTPLECSKEHVVRCFDATLDMMEECPISIILDECCFE